MSRSFKDLPLHPDVAASIQDLGFKEMTPIQEQAIPVALEGHDLLGAAQTGTGKTAAFLIPIIDRLTRLNAGTIRALILTPTRELAQQIDEQMYGLGYHAQLSSICVVGGLEFNPQEQALRKKPDLVIATPGRLLDHMRYDHVDFSGIEMVVLDEADRMLDMGFLPDVQAILDKLPKERQTLLFSATLSAEVKRLAGRFMRNPKEVQIGRQAPAEAIRQRFISVSPADKERLVIELLREDGMDTVLVFARTKIEVRRLGRRLQRSGFACDALHGDRSQEERTAALDRFRRRDINILVATDVASRGLDISDVSHVINYDIPQDPDDYIHRVGRTARAKKAGDAVTFVSNDDREALQRIEKALNRKIVLEGDAPSKHTATAPNKDNGRGHGTTATATTTGKKRRRRGRRGGRKKNTGTHPA